jgi:anti-sigma factor RsiW
MTMPCGDDMKSLLSRYVDGELPAEDRTKVDEHLAGCEGCRDLLGLFQKNENLLSSALSVDAFGDAVVASVMSELKRESPPMARPIEEGFGEWLRARPWLSLAAAALFVVGLIVLLNSSHARDIRDLKTAVARQAELADGSRLQARAATEKAEQLVAHTIDLAAEFNRQALEAGFRRATQKAATPLGFLADDYILVKAWFDPKEYRSFNVFRRTDSAKEEFQRLNDKPLDQPEFQDREFKPGQGYIYRFEGIRADGKTVPSPSIFMRAKGKPELSPERTVRIYCEYLTAPRDLGKFWVQKQVNGKTVSKDFHVRLGERIGGRVAVADVGEVDFTTEFVLAAIGDGIETGAVIYTAPVLDQQGQPVIDEIVNGVAIPMTTQVEVPFPSRPNKKAVLRRVTGTQGQVDEILWAQSSIRVLQSR